MRRAPIAFSLSVLVAVMAGYGAARWGRLDVHNAITSWWGEGPSSNATGSTVTGSTATKQSAVVASAPEPAPPPAGPPLYVADTWQQAARAIDDTATMATNRALIGLARRYLGRPYNAFSLDRGPGERLQLDLTRFDCFLFVEQLLALVNSRRVDTQTEGVQRFTDHVRQLRYTDGQVDYCRRHHYFSRWAEAAERQGYLVNITRFMPGAESRQRPLTFMSSHAASYEPMQVPRNKRCITELEQDLVVNQSYVPLARLAEAMPSLRDGDIFGLVTRVEGLDVTHVGMVELGASGVDAIHAAPGVGVTRSLDLADYASKVEDVIGVMVLRPIPNSDGKAPAP